MSTRQWFAIGTHHQGFVKRDPPAPCAARTPEQSVLHFGPDARSFTACVGTDHLPAGDRLRPQPVELVIVGCGYRRYMFAIPLYAGRAELRPLEPWRAKEFGEHMERAREHIKPWVGPSFISTGLESGRAVLQRYADGQARDDARIFGIWLGGVLVGGIMVVALDTSTGACEVGCWLEPSAQGRGLVTESIGHLIDWAVEERGIDRIEWHTVPGNTRSIAVAHRLGMTRDTTASTDTTEVLAVRAAPWRELRLAMTAPSRQDKSAIDDLTATFFRAFTNTGGATADVDSIYQIFVPNGIITKGGSAPRDLRHPWLRRAQKAHAHVRHAD